MFARIRAASRLARVALHLAYGLCVATAVYPFVSQSCRRRLQKSWSQDLLTLLGVRLAVTGQDCKSGLVVSNHISWLDVFVISSIAPASFVCKSEVRHWPLIGLLCARTDTVFLERGRRNAAQQVSHSLAEKLRNLERAAVFPEGTTSEGASVLPFRGALLQSAIETKSLVQPLALRYLDARGERSTAAAFCGETNLLQSLYAIALAPEIIASIEMLEAIPAADKTRRELCAESHALICQRIANPVYNVDRATVPVIAVWLQYPPFAKGIPDGTAYGQPPLRHL